MDETCGASAQSDPAAAASLHHRPRGPGLAASSWGSRAGRDTRPAGAGVAAAASLSSGCHRLASAPHPAPAAAAATTAAGERWGHGACAATWSSARKRYRALEGTSWPSGPRMRAEGRSRKVRGSALPTPVARGPALGAQARGEPSLTLTRAAVLRSQVGRVLLLSRTARLTVPPQGTCCVGVRRGDPGDLPETVIDSALLFSICGLHFLYLQYLCLQISRVSTASRSGPFSFAGLFQGSRSA